MAHELHLNTDVKMRGKTEYSLHTGAWPWRGVTGSQQWDRPQKPQGSEEAGKALASLNPAPLTSRACGEVRCLWHSGSQDITAGRC